MRKIPGSDAATQRPRGTERGNSKRICLGTGVPVLLGCSLGLCVAPLWAFGALKDGE